MLNVTQVGCRISDLSYHMIFVELVYIGKYEQCNEQWNIIVLMTFIFILTSVWQVNCQK